MNVAAHHLYRRDQKAVAIAFYLAAVAMLPLFLLIVFDEAHVLMSAPGDLSQLLGDVVSNRQLQVTTMLACAWSGWLALRTRTTALSTVFTVLMLLLTVAIVSDFGLRAVVETERWDRVAVRFFPLIAVYAALGAAAEQSGRPWFSRPLYLGSAVVLVAALELFALDGRELQRWGGLSLAPWQSGRVSNPNLLDTVAMMTLNGLLFYLAGAALVRRGSHQAQVAAPFFFAIAPFALLHPLGYLVRTGEYAPRIDWLYAGLCDPDHAPQSTPPATQLLLRRHAEPRDRVVLDRAAPRLVRAAVLGDCGDRGRPGRAGRPGSCSTGWNGDVGDSRSADSGGNGGSGADSPQSQRSEQSKNNDLCSLRYLCGETSLLAQWPQLSLG